MNNYANEYTDSSSNYGSGNYDDLNLFKESAAVTLVKGIIGAVAGAIPGFLLWILIARLGYVSAYCGLFIAGGSMLAYSYMTKKGDLSPVIGFAVCTIVLGAAIVLAVRIDWSWELARSFEETVYPAFFAEAQSYGDFSSAEIKQLYAEAMTELYGFSEPTFANCFNNLGKIVEITDNKFTYIMDYVISAVCGLAGAAATYTKFIKN